MEVPPTPPVMEAPVPEIAAPAPELAAPAPARHRRRRSALLMPALVAPADLPEDAPGRVEVYANPMHNGIAAPAGAAAAVDLAGHAAQPEPEGDEAARSVRDWLVVGLVSAAIVVIFVVGLALTR